MAHPRRTTTNLSITMTGNSGPTDMVQRYQSKPYGGSCIEAGGFIELGTATTVDVLVVDVNGKVLNAATTYTSDTTIAPVPEGVHAPLRVTTTNISNSAHTVTVHWVVKK